MAPTRLNPTRAPCPALSRSLEAERGASTEGYRAAIRPENLRLRSKSEVESQLRVLTSQGDRPQASILVELPLIRWNGR